MPGSAPKCSEEDDTMHGIIGASIQAVPTGDNRANSSKLVSKQSGFSLHAGVACKSNQRKKLERLCRYITRPAIAEQRLSLASNGNVIVALKTPYDDGTSHVVPRTPENESQENSPSARSKAYSMTWAQRLKRVFSIEIEKCEKCGGKARIIASIEDPDVIEKILKHLGLDETSQVRNRSPPSDLFDYSSQLF